MNMRSTRHRMADFMSFRSQWLLLELFGPADSESEQDPIRRLKRKYHRPPFQ